MRNDLPDAFARVVNCSRCTTEDCPTLLRDSHENVPQPGYVGARCEESRILLAGQNPGKCPHRFVKRDAEYTKALRDLAATPNESVFLALSAVLERFVPEWPIHGSYFPLRECGLKLDQIAYCNVVRCRTRRNAAPGPRVVRACIETHFGPWLDLLAPRAVVFVLKWAHDRASHFAHSRRIPARFINRQRSLSAADREMNRAEVVAFVRSVLSRQKSS